MAKDPIFECRHLKIFCWLAFFCKFVLDIIWLWRMRYKF
jgi:hypothetical protein